MGKNFKFALWMLAIPCLAALFAYFAVTPGPVKVNSGQPAAKVEAKPQPAVAAPLTFTDLINIVEKEPKTVKQIIFENGSQRIILERQGQKPAFIAIPPGGESDLLNKATKAQIPVVAEESVLDSIPAWAISVAIMLVFFGTMLWLSQRQQRTLLQGKGMPNQSTAPSPIKKVTFNEVAGCDEAVQELRRVVKSLVGAEVYKSFGAKIPRGYLLKGPPGTGKTLLAKAVAGEMDGFFEGMSGSDFVEMYVGVGASRVRTKCREARTRARKTKKPQILFIDELDAVGGKRGNGLGNGGHQEREQTLNALLVEMDGMQDNEGVIFMAATNRPEMLDEALLRPGRFEVHIEVPLPDVAGREKIFAIHTRNKPLAPGVSLTALAQSTYGYSGAEIEGACSRAAVIAAERYGVQKLALEGQNTPAEEIDKILPKEITLQDLDEGAAFIKYGAPITSRQKAMLEKDKLNTAYHESGHACVAGRLKHANPVTKITIMMRGRALGYVQQMPDHDQVSLSDQQALARIIVCMAGRAAQEVYTNTVDAGASNDFEQATGMARMMVTKWGMSRLGPLSVGDRGESPMGMGSSGGTIAYGDELANEIDREVLRIVRHCYRLARLIVEKDKERMEALCQLLMTEETILRPQFEEMLKAIPSKVEDDELVFDLAAPEAEKK